MSTASQLGNADLLPRRTDTSSLSEHERFALFEIALRSGNVPRRGRPKKGIYQPKWTDFGWTRQQVHRMRRMAQIADDEFETYVHECLERGKRASVREALVRFGKINVATEDIFEGTPTVELAEVSLRPVERIFREMNRGERRAFLHALRFRLRCIAAAADFGGEG